MMEAKYFVIEQRPCAKCRGEGWVQHHEWAQIEERWEGLHGQGRKPWGKFVEFAERFHRREYHNDDLPDEEVTCNLCSGEGFIQMETQLVDALEALGIGLPKGE